MMAKSQQDSSEKKGRQPTACSRVSNGSGYFVERVDGRSIWARRFRDLIEAHLSDLGGREAASEAERSIVRRIAALEVELERMEGAFARAGQAEPETLDLYNRTAGNLRRLLDAIGMERRARDVTPDLATYAKRKGEQC